MREKSKGVSLLGLVFILVLALVFMLFLGLKIGGVSAVAAWSWWWVTSPLWFPLAVYVSILAIRGMVSIVLAVHEPRWRSR